MERILLSDFLLEWLAQEDSKDFTIIFRKLGVQIKEAARSGDLTGVIKEGYYSVLNGKPMRVKEPKENNKGLIQDFRCIRDSMSNWFNLPIHKEKDGFLIPKSKKKSIPKNTDDMSDEEYIKATEQYAESLRRVPKPRAKRNNS
jgi:hypothetical protein